MEDRKMIEGDIFVTPTGMRITPYYKGQSYPLENATSVKNYPYNNRSPFTGFLIPSEGNKKEGTFVTHLHDGLFIQELFPKYRITIQKPSYAKKLTQEIRLNENITPREAQYQIMQEIIDNEKRSSWFVYLTQGMGKTLLTVYMIPYFDRKTLIMCYNTNVLEQWIDTMLTHTNMNADRILRIRSTGLLDDIESGKHPVDMIDVFLCTPGLLTKYGKKYGYDRLDSLIETMGIGLKVFDEAHRNIANIIKINAYTRVEKTLYLSGDFSQSDLRKGGKRDLFLRMFHNTPVLRPSEDLMNTLRYTVATVIFFNSKPTPMEQTSVYTKRGFSAYNYMKYQLSKGALMETLQFVLDGIMRINTTGYKILVLVNMVEHVNILKETLEDVYKDSGYDVCRFHSEVSSMEKQYCKEHGSLIISTYQSFGVGLDVSLIKYVITCGVCNMIDDNQAAGRARPLPDGSEVIYFMFADTGFTYTKEKLPIRLRYLKETKIKRIEKIKYDVSEDNCLKK